MSYYTKPGIHIRDKIKIVLKLSNYATKKADHVAGVDISNLAAKNGFTALKAEWQIDIAKLVNVPTSLNKLKTKIRCW